MTKQNFISMSLESGLKYVDLLCEPDDNICTLKGILNGLYCDEHGNVDCEINDCMPILRPLSDLHKEMQDDRTYLQYFECMFNFESDNVCPIRMYISSGWTTTIDELPFEIVSKLIEWHFDIYNLISKNQAIDINTLETNPYK